MHKMRNEPRTKDGPQTTGLTLHWASQYELFSNVMGLGTNGPNSRMVIELAKIASGEAVLDVACGTGSLTLTAHTRARPGRVHGIDASPEMIEAARRKSARLGGEVVFDVGLIENLAFPDATFDVVITRLAIHHLPDDLKQKAFREILRVLKPGGRLLVVDFNPPANPIVNHIASALVGSHMMQTSVKNLPAMVAEAGFVEVASGPTRSVFMAFVSGKRPKSLGGGKGDRIASAPH